jgi:hypothetical protein
MSLENSRVSLPILLIDAISTDGGKLVGLAAFLLLIWANQSKSVV